MRTECPTCGCRLEVDSVLEQNEDGSWRIRTTLGRALLHEYPNPDEPGMYKEKK
mgnify:CR=1 FL=1